MAAAKLHGDDTPVPVLQPGRKTTKLGRLWGYLRDDRPAGSTEPAAVWFSYSPDRKGKWPAKHLSEFSGTLQADGYAGYNALYATNRIQEAACWAHVRRKFFDINKKQPDGFAAEVLASIADLYGIEKMVKGKDPEYRAQMRQSRAGPILQQLENRLRAKLGTVAKKMPLAKAIHYALTRWQALLAYVDDGTIEIDNNPIERQIRPVVLGRKNSYDLFQALRHYNPFRTLSGLNMVKLQQAIRETQSSTVNQTLIRRLKRHTGLRHRSYLDLFAEIA